MSTLQLALVAHSTVIWPQNGNVFYLFYLFTCLAHLASPQNESEVCWSTWTQCLSYGEHCISLMCIMCLTLYIVCLTLNIVCLTFIVCLKHPDEVELVVLYPESGVRSLSGSPWHCIFYSIVNVSLYSLVYFKCDKFPSVLLLSSFEWLHFIVYSVQNTSHISTVNT